MSDPASDFVHTAIIGPTRCGKSSVARAFAAGHMRAGEGVIVCDPKNEPWPCSHRFVTARPFIAYATRARSCALIIDESGKAMKSYEDKKELEWAVTMAAGWGMAAYVIATYLKMLNPTFRTNCTRWVLFRQPRSAVRELSDILSRDDLMGLTQLGQYEYAIVTAFGPLRRYRIR